MVCTWKTSQPEKGFLNWKLLAEEAISIDTYTHHLKNKGEELQPHSLAS